MMNIHCCPKWTSVGAKKLICLLLCISVACLITYRVHVWLKHYDSLASKMIISAYEDHQSNLPFPLISICNINPARGTKLYNIQSAESQDRGVDYEIFSDAFQGRSSENLPESKLKVPIFKLMEKASHQIDQMLRSCKVGQRHCSVLNFTKSILPNGACYTLAGDLSGIDEIQLVLDPQSYDYLVPNQGFIGFRILLHGYGDSLWALIPTAVYAGPTFHTMLRAVGLKKIYKQHCTSQSIWASCMHDCMQEMLLEKCHCQLPDCTVFEMMKCGLTMNSMIESLSPVQCRCHNPCEAISYSVESITQALKSPLLFTHSLSLFTKINQTNFQSNNNFQLLTDQQQFNNKIISKNQKLTTVSDDISDYDSNNNNHKNSKELNINQSEQFLHIYRKEIWDGLLLQTWAFLREANRTAFEQLRQLSRLLQSLNLDLQTVERTVYKVHRKHRFNLEATDLMLWDSERLSTNKHPSDQSNGLCMDSEEHSRMLERVSRLGKEFVRLFRQSILFRDITLVPGLDFHIHLVRLFFLNVVDELDRLANQLLHNDLFSDVTMLDLQRKTNQCKQTNNKLIYNDTSWENQLEQSQLIVASEDIASLQAVLLATDSQFKQLRTVFSKLVLDNRELIETVPIKRASLNTKPDSLISTEEGLVSVTIQLTRDKNRLIRLESVQAIYSPIAELLDLIVSGLLLAFLSIFLLNICVSHPNNSDSCYYECCCCCSTLVNKSTNSKSCESPKLVTHTTLPTASYINCNTDSGSSSKRLPKLNTIPYRNYSDLIPTDILQKKPTVNSVYLFDSHQQDGVPISNKCIITGLPITSNKPCAKGFGENCRHNFNMCPNESTQYITHNLPTLPGSSVTLPKWDNKVLQIDVDGFNCMDVSEHSTTECEGEQSHANTNQHYSCHQQQSLPRQQQQQLNHQQNGVNESCISFCDCLYSIEDNTKTDSASCLNSSKLLFCNNHSNTMRNCSSIRKPTDINYSKNEMLNCLIVTPQLQDTTFNEVTPNIVTTHQLPFSVDLLQSSQLIDDKATLPVNTSH
ncbi:unnamed protein product [Schistosoma bovis]|nr:unnamed protein product [Schistosoma bovis]CAH8579797.1 unnamed protein product [Schistosoma bovis]